MRIFLFLFFTASAFYYYFFFRRALNTFGVNTKSLSARLLLGFLAVCLGGTILMFPRLEAVIVLHFLALSIAVQLLNFIAKRAAGKKYPESLKKLYGSGIVPILLTAAVLAFGWWNMHHVVQTDYTVRTHKDIRPEGYRVALIADVHYGVSVGYEDLMEVCAEVSRQNPDVVILCGDIVDNNTTRPEMTEVFQALGTIESTYGSFYVYGNHDRPMSLVASAYTEAELNDAIESNGITILKDEIRVIAEDFVLAGRDDRGYGSGNARMSIAGLLNDVNRDAFILTLDHQPNEYAENGAAGTDLLLSGHTHGGQLWPANLVDSIFRINDAVYGHTQIDDDTQAIVTSGFAGWYWPIKTSAPAEYVIIDIQP